jgi:hypothetical protein
LVDFRVEKITEKLFTEKTHFTEKKQFTEIFTDPAKVTMPRGQRLGDVV